MKLPPPAPVSRRRLFIEFFALERSLVLLLVAIFLIGSGEELWMRFIPPYLKQLGAAALVAVIDEVNSIITSHVLIVSSAGI